MDDAALNCPSGAAAAPLPALRWDAVESAGPDIERDVLRGRWFEFGKRCMPDCLSQTDRLPHLRPAEARFITQIEARTYVNVLAVVRARVVATAAEADAVQQAADSLAEATPIVSVPTDGPLQLCRRLEQTAAGAMPPGYVVAPPGPLLDAFDGASTWALHAMRLLGELAAQRHHRASSGPDPCQSALWQDVFAYLGQQGARYATLGERRWRRHDARLTAAQREQGVGDLIHLWSALDGLLKQQAARDADYFLQHATPAGGGPQKRAIGDVLHTAYRRLFIEIGARTRRFVRLLDGMTSTEQRACIARALSACSDEPAG